MKTGQTLTSSALILLASALLALGCKKDDNKGEASCSNTDRVFKVGDQSYNVVGTDCDAQTINGKRIWYTTAETNMGDMTVVLGEVPTTSGTYTVIATSDDTTMTLSAKQAAIGFDSADSEYYCTGGGTVRVTVVNGKPTVNFCNVPAAAELGKNVPLSGKWTCN